MRNLRVQKRTDLTPVKRLINVVIFVLLALVFCAFFVAYNGNNPLEVYAKMLKTIVSVKGLQKSIVAGLPLIFTGLAVAFGYRMNLNNIGADGQYAFGAIFCIWFALYGPDMPAVPKIILMFVFACAGGAFVALLAAIPKALWDVNETIMTMMLNYVALYVLNYLTYGPWKESGQMVAQTAEISERYYLPDIGNTGINSILLIAIAIAVVLYFFHSKTTKGFEMEVVRKSPGAARYAGIHVKKNIILVLAVSGAIAGLAGFAQVGGIIHRVQADMPNGAGYTGIVIAYLAGLNPLVVVIVGILFGALQISAVAVQVSGVPSQIATMIQGSIMLFVIAGDFFTRYKIVRTKPDQANGSDISRGNESDITQKGGAEV
ncbi:MAG: ABC transporter permease [Clostridiales bacterium]|nr:ABC transporter permease [Clostridiales bacterium]